MAMKLSIGPIQYFWEKQRVFDFYNAIINSPVDIVYLGETICAKRRQLCRDDWLDIGRQLTLAGKEVILSSLTLFEAESELAALRRIIENGKYTVEANDMAAVQLLKGSHNFVIGPHVNCYNSSTLQILNEMGAKRWVIPVEINCETVSKLRQSHPAVPEMEVLGFGHLPLAFSARCYTARAHNRPKDQCDYICLDYPDGLPLYTQQGDAFLVLNGIQTQSAGTHNLATYLGELEAIGIDIIRIMPQSVGTPGLIEIFHDFINGKLQLADALQQLAPYQKFGSCNGYWSGREGMADVGL